MHTAAELAFMQDTQEQAMPGTVVIERYTFTPDGTGMAYEAWTALGTVIGRIYPVVRRGQAEITAGAQTTSLTRWVGTLPEGTDVLAKDRLLYDSRTWEVTQVNNSEMWMTALRCELEAFNEERRA